MNPTDGDTEGMDGTHVHFQERLTPSMGIWLFVFLMTVSLGIAYGQAFGATIGLTVGMLSTAVAALLLIATRDVIRVDDKVFRAGKARLPVRFIGDVIVLDQHKTRESLHANAHRNAFLLTKGWIHESVIVQNLDQSDPHPYWQVSSRQVQALSSALIKARMVS